jgi:hypothetical protein
MVQPNKLKANELREGLTVAWHREDGEFFLGTIKEVHEHGVEIEWNDHVFGILPVREKRIVDPGQLSAWTDDKAVREAQNLARDAVRLAQEMCQKFGLPLDERQSLLLHNAMTHIQIREKQRRQKPG